MGFETVGLVMGFEEEFGVDIPESASERLRSVGDVANYILEELQRFARTEIDAASVFDRVRAITVEQLGVNSNEVFRFVEDLGVD